MLFLNRTEIFSFDEAKKVHKNKYKDIKCKDDDDCPGWPFCIEGECVNFFYCVEDFSRCTDELSNFDYCNDKNCDERYCFIEKIDNKSYCNRKKNIECVVNEDCNLTNKCVNNKCVGKVMEVEMVGKHITYGLTEGEKCVFDRECFSNNCKNGVCGRIMNLAALDYMFAFPFALAFLIIIGIYLLRHKKKQS